MPAGRTLFGIVEDLLAAIGAGDDRVLILLQSIDFVVVLFLELVGGTAVLPPIVVFGFDHFVPARELRSSPCGPLSGETNVSGIDANTQIGHPRAERFRNWPGLHGNER